MAVDIIVITHNRLNYTQKTIKYLLCNKDDINLYIWDNGSTDGTRQYIESLNSEKIKKIQLHGKNVKQFLPVLWFLEQSTSDIIGKIDDDTLVPDGWTTRIVSALKDDERFGMLGCWIFWPDDFYRNREYADSRTVELSNHKLLHMPTMGGTAFLMRRNLAERYLLNNSDGTAFPIDRVKLSYDGFYSGFLMPLIFAEHMDDPRSVHCEYKDYSSENSAAALTARVRKFKNAEEYQSWIMNDADFLLRNSVKWHVYMKIFKRSRLYRILLKINRIIRRLSGKNRVVI